jgi:hypothetical protein
MKPMLARKSFRRRLPRNNSERIQAKQGWRTIGGKRCFFRSKQEANHARYLEFLKQRGIIKDWEHEPVTFWFDGIKRGINNYKPDFRVMLLNGEYEFHEVKGWMDSRSKTKIKRMKKYHPQVVLKVFGISWYRSVSAKLKKIINDWE